ncbi:hypothetical protein [Gordonia shandongensis]|uniref:hypothetical protein n=1 Tax=Gordonia shandongensis TaxID=376351 RepID=UPI00040FBA21|nr:hypothetical protein [Gordonia shandongensis]
MTNPWDHPGAAGSGPSGGPNAYPPYPQGMPPQGPLQQGPLQQGMPGMPPQGRPPKSPKTGLIVALVLVVALAVGGGVIGILQPWKSDSETSASNGSGGGADDPSSSAPSSSTPASTPPERFDLAGNLSATMSTPPGWRSVAIRFQDKPAFAVVPESDTRPPAALEAAIAAINVSETSDAMRATLVYGRDCTGNDGDLRLDQWQTGTVDVSDKDRFHLRNLRFGTRVDSSSCVVMFSFDFDPAGPPPTSEGVDLGKQIVADRLLSVGTAV